MALRRDERGQALQIGAVLLLGLFVLMLTLYQATIVPQQNARTEFESYQQASEDMLNLRNDVIASASRAVQAGTSVKTGARYRPRVIFVNPGPPLGSLSTTSNRTVTFDHVAAVATEPNNTQTVWNGTPRDYKTQAVRFSPAYNEFDGQPLVFSGVSLYYETPGGPIQTASQTLISGNRITLLTIQGNMSTSAYTTSVTTEPVSAHMRTITVTGEDRDGDGTNEDFSIYLATEAEATEWADSKIATDIRRNPNVVSVSVTGPNEVRITFDGTRAYKLRLAQVEVHEQDDTGAILQTSPEYLVHAAGDETIMHKNQSAKLTAEVRDHFNNPVTGASVYFNTSHGTFLTTGSGTRTLATDDEGQATVRFRPNQTGTLRVQAHVDVNGDGAYTQPQETTNFTVYVS